MRLSGRLPNPGRDPASRVCLPSKALGVIFCMSEMPQGTGGGYQARADRHRFERLFRPSLRQIVVVVGGPSPIVGHPHAWKPTGAAHGFRAAGVIKGQRLSASPETDEGSVLLIGKGLVQSPDEVALGLRPTFHTATRPCRPDSPAQKLGQNAGFPNDSAFQPKLE